MTYNPDIHNRKSIRLKGYDYSQEGPYFITICTENRKCLFGEIDNGEMTLNCAGKIIKKEWEKITEQFPNVVLDSFVIMPNHFHAIVIIEYKRGHPQGDAPTGTANEKGNKTIGDIIGAFKSFTTNAYISAVKEKKLPFFDNRIWQRNYHEHIIRNEESFH